MCFLNEFIKEEERVRQRSKQRSHRVNTREAGFPTAGPAYGLRFLPGHGSSSGALVFGVAMVIIGPCFSLLSYLGLNNSRTVKDWPDRGTPW